MKPEIAPKTKGLGHVLDAFVYSWDGFKSALEEAAFRIECVCFLIVLIAAWSLCFLGLFSVMQAAILTAGWMMVAVVEMLNTAIESVVDLVSPEYHVLAKRAKDLGSVAAAFAVGANCVLWISFLGNLLLEFMFDIHIGA